MFRLVARRSYTVSRVAFAEAAPVAEGDLVVNFCTPYASVVPSKAVEMITLPGENGVYAITKGHAPTVSQLQPGVVSIAHVDVSFFFFFFGDLCHFFWVLVCVCVFFFHCLLSHVQ